MKVYGIGLPRTGTTTLKTALRILGYTHNVDSFVGDGMCMPLDKYKQIDKAVPDAKFIFTYRATVNIWYQSVVNRTEVIKNNPAVFDQRERMYGSRELNEKMYSKVYHNRFFDVMGYFYNRYGPWMDNKVVYLCWELGDSWDRLCEFLGKDIPDVPFPHKNKSK